MLEPRIDVVMSVFNGARTIEQAVSSIRNQTVEDIRIIVVDDGSTDGTNAILRRIAQEDPRLLVLSKPNSGIVDSLEMGLARCTAPLVARHDADDISDPQRFETQMAYLAEHPDCVAVSGGARYIDAEGNDTGRKAKIVDIGSADADWIPAREPYLKQPFLMVRREALIAVGGYRPLHVAEDSDLCWRLRDVGRLHNMDRPLGAYRVHDDSISSGSIRNGRVIALYSQLVALSARRRMMGRVDLRFKKTDHDDYSGAVTLSELHAIASRQLDADEQRRLRIGMAAKLVEVCFYRSFELDRSDSSFIQDAMREANGLMRPDNQLMLSRSVMQTALRLATGGRIADAMLLLPRRRRPAMAIRLAFRVGLPPVLRGRIKRAIRFRRAGSDRTTAARPHDSHAGGLPTQENASRRA